MRKALPRWLLLHVPYLVLFAYSLHGVGVCCDDFDLLVSVPRDRSFGYLLANPANILTHGLPFLWIGYERQALYDLLLTRLGSRVRRSYVSEVGAVVAAHTGPGVIGVCISRH